MDSIKNIHSISFIFFLQTKNGVKQFFILYKKTTERKRKKEKEKNG